ncbi:MAG: VOC family protein [Candidatus Thorarchaeota archaeon]
MLGPYDHIGIVVKEIEKSIKFYSEVLGWKLPESGPYSNILNIDVPGEKIKYAMLSSGDTYLELIEPEEGVWKDFLDEKGEGAICELCVLVDDIDKAREQIERMGLTPMNRFRKPLKKGFEEAPSGSKYFYLPSEETLGTWIEILQRASHKA